MNLAESNSKGDFNSVIYFLKFLGRSRPPRSYKKDSYNLTKRVMYNKKGCKFWAHLPRVPFEKGGNS